MKDDKTPEGLQIIDDSLVDADSTLHPFHDPTFRKMVKAMAHVLSVAEHKPPTSEAEEGSIISKSEDAGISDIERMRRDAVSAGKPFRVPEWWRGEKANYKIAQALMPTLPKTVGSPVFD